MYHDDSLFFRKEMGDRNDTMVRDMDIFEIEKIIPPCMGLSEDEVSSRCSLGNKSIDSTTHYSQFIYLYIVTHYFQSYTGRILYIGVTCGIATRRGTIQRNPHFW